MSKEIINNVRGLTKASPTAGNIQKCFPPDVLPKKLQNIVNCGAEYYNHTVDYACSYILVVASAAIGGSWRVEVGKEYRVPVNLFLAVVGNSSVNKTAVYDFYTKPLREQDGVYARQYEEEYKQYKAIKKTDTTSEPEEPKNKKRLTSDATGEALIAMHTNNPLGVFVTVDELMGWVNGLTNYNNGGQLEKFLSFWSGTAVSVDRKTTTSSYIPYPFVAVCGNIQFHALLNMAINGRLEVGFFNRFLYAITEKPLPPYWIENYDTVPDISLDWCSIIKRIMDVCVVDGNVLEHKPRYARFKPDAWAVLREWQHKNVDTLIAPEMEDSERAMYAKLDSNVLRISFIMQMLYYATDEANVYDVIELRAAQAAVKIIKYYTYTALKAHNKVTNTDPLENLYQWQQDLYNQLPDEVEFKTGDAIAIYQNITGEKSYEAARHATMRFLNRSGMFKSPKKSIWYKLF